MNGATQGLTDAQLGLILAAIATLGGSLIAALKWAVNRVTKSNDDGTAALLANTASNATLIATLSNLARQIERLDDFVKEEVSGVYEGQPQKRRGAPTPRGVGVLRPGTYRDEDR
jgi:hypothetical protein